MMGSRFPWFRVSLLAVVLAVSATILIFWGSEVLKTTLTITGVGLMTTVLWVVKGISDWRSGVAEIDKPRLEAATEQLARAVRDMWGEEAAQRGLTTPLPIAVQVTWADRRITAHPAQWLRGNMKMANSTGTSGDAGVVGTTADMAAIYRDIATGRLVIIGEPGAGKTAAALLLLLALCDSRQLSERVPVMFSLATWRPDAESVEQWIIKQLTATYGASEKLAHALAGERKILPFFDGLDELPDEVRPTGLAALRGLIDTPLVLTSRTQEFTDALVGHIIEKAAVV